MTTTPPPPPGSNEQQPYGPTWQDPQSGQGQPPQQQNWGPGHPLAPPVPPQPVPPQPEPKKKSWFRRHKILTGLLAIVGLGIVGNALNGGDDEPTDAATAVVAEQPATQDSAPDAVEAEPAGDADAEPAVAEPAEPATEESTPAAEETEPAAETPGLNDPVRDGKLEFTVTGIETGLTTVGEGFSEETPQGQFVMVNITVTNIGDQGTTMFDSAQILLDEQGREHNTSSASIWLDEGLWLDEINPGNSMNGVLLYDIPTDAIPTTLELHDSMFSDGITVSLK